MTPERREVDKVARLQRRLADLDARDEPAQWMQTLATEGLADLPMPGAGFTLQRWQALAAVAARDLSLVKLYEGHTDAIAILAELAHPTRADRSEVWGVWAAEAPGTRVVIEATPGAAAGRVRLIGTKCWCSGAGSVSHGLMTAWHADGRGPQLVAVPMRQPGVSVNTELWQAVGMAGSASVNVVLDAAEAQPVGEIGAYLHRPGFWQGGAGIAACWYGGAAFLAAALQAALTAAQAAAAHRPPASFREAALGRADVELRATAALLHEAARWIDAHPTHDAGEVALRVRLRAEGAAKAVLDTVGTALGAAPFCRDARFARMAADLPVFIRQSHGECDFAALGERVLAAAKIGDPWSL